MRYRKGRPLGFRRTQRTRSGEWGADWIYGSTNNIGTGQERKGKTAIPVPKRGRRTVYLRGLFSRKPTDLSDPQHAIRPVQR